MNSSLGKAPPLGTRRLPSTVVCLAALTLALTGGAGCAASCPRYDESHWREVSTRNFRLRTDLDEAEARKTLEEFETVRAALLTSFGASLETDTGQVPVIALDEGWGPVGGPLVEGGYGRVLFSPHIVIRAGSTPAGQTSIKHGLANHLSGSLRPHEPLWLSAGLGTYFETLQVSDDKKVVIVGRPQSDVVAYLQGPQGILSVERLRAESAAYDSWSGFYPSAWLLVHYLMNHRQAAFRSYQNALAGSANEPEAWNLAFAGLAPSTLDGELRAYLNGGRYSVFNFPFVPVKADSNQVRSLTVSDGHATRALAYAMVRREAEKGADYLPRSSDELAMCARQEVDAAMAGAPGHTLALAVKAWELGDPIDLGAVQNGAKANPNDWMAWWLLATTLQAQGISDDRYEQAAEKARTLAQGNHAVQLSLQGARR
jgi:hypothetical protein